jgi:hypothetical protein
MSMTGSSDASVPGRVIMREWPTISTSAAEKTAGNEERMNAWRPSNTDQSVLVSSTSAIEGNERARPSLAQHVASSSSG